MSGTKIIKQLLAERNLTINQLSELLKELGECFYLCLISIEIILA